jgi:peroxiredoxin
MKIKVNAVILLLAAVLLVTMVPLRAFAQTRAPEFTLKDLQNKTFNLKDYRTKAVLLIFGTTWCPSCRSEIPHFKEIFAKYNPRGLEVAYVNIEEPQDRVLRFSSKHQLPYRTLLDSKAVVADAYNIRGVPHMILIKEGKVVTSNYRLIDSYLEKLFAPSSR